MNLDSICCTLLYSNTSLITQIYSLTKTIVRDNYFWKLLCVRDYDKYYKTLPIHLYQKNYEYCNNLLKLKNKLELEGSIYDLFANGISRINNPNLKSIPNEIKYLGGEHFFELTTPKLQRISPSIYEMDLFYIICNEAKLIKLPCPREQIYKLNSVEFRYNQIEVIPKKIGNFRGIGMLFLDNNNIYSIPPELCQLNNLLILHLNSNRIRKIPNEIKYLYELTHLHLDNNKIKSIPKKLYKLSNLEYLDLTNNNITKISKGIFQLTSIEYLKFASNKITKIPNEFNKLDYLKVLELDDNKLITIPKIPNRVKVIKLNHNKLICLPTNISGSSNIRELYLNNNYLLDIPNSITTFQLLEIFIVKNNLNSIPNIINIHKK